MKTTSKHFKNILVLLACFFAGVLAFFSSVYYAVDANRKTVDYNLGTQSWTVITEKQSEDEDLYNYRAKVDKSNGIDCSTVEGLFEYQQRVSERLAEEGVVLLKNNNHTLPLITESDRRITLFGSRSYTKIVTIHQWGLTFVRAFGTQYGGSSGSIAPGEEVVAIAEALRTNGFSVNAEVESVYNKWFEGNGANDTSKTPNEVSTIYSVNETEPASLDLNSFEHTFAGTAIVTVGRPWKEGGYYLPGDSGRADEEFSPGVDALGLSKNELATLAYVKAQKDAGRFDKIVLLINAVQMDVPELDDYADAILWVGLPGCYGFNAVARILNGEVSPSGRLADTFAVKASNAISMVNYGVFEWSGGGAVTIDKDNYKNAYYMAEVESIYTGYRYYETRYYDSVLNQFDARGDAGATNGNTSWKYENEVVWSFGEGLSYADFTETLESIDVDYQQRKITAKITVENAGTKYSGKHPVQLYVSCPYSGSGLQKSALQLIGFKKTGVLAPGTSEQLTVSCHFSDFASYDEKLEHHGLTGAYVLDEGAYLFAIGKGAHDAANNIFAKQGMTAEHSGGWMTDDGNAKLARSIDIPRVEITESRAGVKISNQLQDMDLSKELLCVKNFSRSSWQNNWPEAYNGLTPPESYKNGLECKVYSISANGNPELVKFGLDNGLSYTDLKPASPRRLEYDDPRLKMYVEQITLEDALNVMLTAADYDLGPFSSTGQPAIYADDGLMGFNKGTLASGGQKAGTDYKAVDHEWSKRPMRTLPTAVVIGATFNEELIEEAGEMMANLALWNGFSCLQGPGVNLHRNAYNGRNHEYYSEDPVLTGVLAAAFSRGAMNYGLVTELKHFAFNDTEANRAGVAPFMSEQKAREGELRCYQIGIENGDIYGIMTGFNRAGAYYSSAHAGLMRGILRGEWAFRGYVVSDMAGGVYMNARDAIAAGTDAMLNNNVTAYDKATLIDRIADIKKDANFLGAVQDALIRIQYTFINSNYMNGINGSSKLVRLYTWYDKLLISIIALSGAVVFVCIAGQTFLIIKRRSNAGIF